MPQVVTPDWVKHAVFYQIFPDRFARSERVTKPSNLEPWDADPTPHGYKGGDLLGVAERLDYLRELGVTALYFNPIFQSASNHRYHTHDYYRVDPLLGGDEAFDEMLRECKRRGIRVVLDGVFNHASRGFFQFNDILENGAASPWLDWFYLTGEHPLNAYDVARLPGYTGWADLRALPKLNTHNPQVREFLMRVGEHWIRKGIDGWRLDVPNEVTGEGFWEEFRERVKRINPEAYIVGEVWEDASRWLRGDQFDGVMNYLFTGPTIAFTAGGSVRPELVAGRSYRPYPKISAPEYADVMERLLALYPWEIQLTQLNLLDSHDTARFLTLADGDESGVRLGALLLFTFPGAPCIYYGDEIGLTGGMPDHWARRSFPWDRPETWNRDLLDLYKRLIALRHAHPALRVGKYRRLLAEGDVYAFARRLDDATLIVAVNVADAPKRARLPHSELVPAGSLPVVLFGDAAVEQDGAGFLSLALPARGGAVLDASPPSLAG